MKALTSSRIANSFTIKEWQDSTEVHWPTSTKQHAEINLSWSTDNALIEHHASFLR
jgi:hypothetical protein